MGVKRSLLNNDKRNRDLIYQSNNNNNNMIRVNLSLIYSSQVSYWSTRTWPLALPSSMVFHTSGLIIINKNYNENITKYKSHKTNNRTKDFNI